MKNKPLIYLACMAGIAVLCACGTTPSETKATPREEKTLTLSFDKRVETTYLVLMLTGKYDMLISRHATRYKTDAQKYFSAYQNHPAVLTAAALIDKGFSFDYAASWICQFSDFPAFDSAYTVDFPFYQPEANGGRNITPGELENLRQNLRDFYQTAHCDSFFRMQQPFLEKMLDQTRTGLSDPHLPAKIEAYYGVDKTAEFQLVLSPLSHGGGFEIDCQAVKTGTLNLVAILGPSGVENQAPQFDKAYLEQDLIIHEFGHSYENPIVDRYMPQTLPYRDNLFPPIQEIVKDEGCDGWETFMHELIDRAVTLRIVERQFGKEAATQLLQYEQSVGFGYVADIADELKSYENQRDQYPTLESFFPQIVKRLGQIKPKA